jgi:hypothetical protein
MKKLGIHVLILFIIFGCASTVEQLRTKNRENLLRLSFGMTKFDVLQIMGTETIESVNNPYRVETPKGKDGSLYEVLFYNTDKKKKGDRITDGDLTPLVFKDNALIGWGWAFLSEVVPNYQYQIEVQ